MRVCLQPHRRGLHPFKAGQFYANPEKSEALQAIELPRPAVRCTSARSRQLSIFITVRGQTGTARGKSAILLFKRTNYGKLLRCGDRTGVGIFYSPASPGAWSGRRQDANLLYNMGFYHLAQHLLVYKASTEEAELRGRRYQHKNKSSQNSNNKCAVILTGNNNNRQEKA